MNRSFENIFEKYNISCDVPKKRNKTKPLTQPQTIHKIVKDSTIAQKNAAGDLISSSSPNFNSSCFYNRNSEGKYSRPTRYKSLDIIRVETVHKELTVCSNSFNKNENICDDKWISRQNCIEQLPSTSGDKAEYPNCVKFEKSLYVNKITPKKSSQPNSITASTSYMSDCTKYGSPDGFNMLKSKHTCKSRRHYKQLEVTPIQKRKNSDAAYEKPKHETLNDNNDIHDDSYQTFQSTITKPAETEENHTKTMPLLENTPTELDLLIDLIEKEEKSNKNAESHKKNQKYSNCDDDLPRSKPCLKGGYEEMFEKALKHEKVKSYFLKHDKKMGLRNGQLLTVVNIETSYGVTMATVKSEDLNKNFGVVVSGEMAPQLKLGGQIEAFFDDKSYPYKLQRNGECLDVYLQPYKLLIV